MTTENGRKSNRRTVVAVITGLLAIALGGTTPKGSATKGEQQEALTNREQMDVSDRAAAIAAGETQSALTHELMSRYVSMPVMYGAGIDRTGQTDSTSDMQAFIDDRPFARIYVPEGIYKFSQLVLASGQTLVGAGRSTARDRYTTFGATEWLLDSNFGGTVFRSTAQSGTSLAINNTAEVTEGGLENLTLIGSGTGTAVGLQLGNNTGPSRSMVNIRLSNVVVGNFTVGIWAAYINEGVFDHLILRGNELGMDLAISVNHNSFYALDIQWCGDGFRLAKNCHANGFYTPIMQSNSGTAANISGKKNKMSNPYLENNAHGLVFESGAIGNSVDTPFTNNASDSIWFKPGANENTLTSVGWTGGTSYIRNEGERNLLQGRLSNLTELGSDTIIVDPILTGTPFGQWKAYTPTVAGDNWSLGSGTANADYTMIGKTVHFRVLIKFGSTTTYGENSPTVELPFPALFRGEAHAVMVKSGTASYAMIARLGADNATSVTIDSFGANGRAQKTTANYPTVWASGDTLEVYGTYQAA